jgi:hypothetical protein
LLFVQLDATLHLPQTKDSLTLDSLPSSLLWAVHEYALPLNLSLLVASISAGTAPAVSDGSFKDKFGTSAFTTLDALATSIIGLNAVPGHSNDQGAYRSESMVFCSLLTFFVLGQASLLVASKWALNKAFGAWPLEPTDPHFDMLTPL